MLLFTERQSGDLYRHWVLRYASVMVFTHWTQNLGLSPPSFLPVGELISDEYCMYSGFKSVPCCRTEGKNPCSAGVWAIYTQSMSFINRNGRWMPACCFVSLLARFQAKACIASSGIPGGIAKVTFTHKQIHTHWEWCSHTPTETWLFWKLDKMFTLQDSTRWALNQPSLELVSYECVLSICAYIKVCLRKVGFFLWWF